MNNAFEAMNIGVRRFYIDSNECFRLAFLQPDFLTLLHLIFKSGLMSLVGATTSFRGGLTRTGVQV